jgi:hypothetical protein
MASLTPDREFPKLEDVTDPPTCATCIEKPGVAKYMFNGFTFSLTGLFSASDIFEYYTGSEWQQIDLTGRWTEFPDPISISGIRFDPEVSPFDIFGTYLPTAVNPLGIGTSSWGATSQIPGFSIRPSDKLLCEKYLSHIKHKGNISRYISKHKYRYLEIIIIIQFNSSLCSSKQ